MTPTTYQIRAYCVAKSISLTELERQNQLALLTQRRNFVVYQPAADRFMAVFSYGVVVLFNFDEKISPKFVELAARYGADPLEKPKVEEYTVILDPSQKVSAEFNHVVLHKLDPEQIALIAEVLAQSVAIDAVEERVDTIVGKFDRIHAALAKDGRIPVRDVEIRKLIGASRTLIQYVITQLSLLDKPDVTWEDKELEALFVGMRKMFELEDRFRTMEFRLNFIQDTSEMIMHILESRRSVKLELWIIGLFILDLVIVLYEALFK
jgi:uncharacterized Rmd1/YagE family protein